MNKPDPSKVSPLQEKRQSIEVRSSLHEVCSLDSNAAKSLEDFFSRSIDGNKLTWHMHILDMPAICPPKGEKEALARKRFKGFSKKPPFDRKYGIIDNEEIFPTITFSRTTDLNSPDSKPEFSVSRTSSVLKKRFKFFQLHSTGAAPLRKDMLADPLIKEHLASSSKAEGLGPELCNALVLSFKHSIAIWAREDRIPLLYEHRNRPNIHTTFPMHSNSLKFSSPIRDFISYINAANIIAHVEQTQLPYNQAFLDFAAKNVNERKEKWLERDIEREREKKSQEKEETAGERFERLIKEGKVERPDRGKS